MKTKLAALAGLVLYAGIVWWVMGRIPPDEVPGRVTVRIAHWQTESGVREGLEDVIRHYEQLHPNVHVEQMIIPENVYKQWLQAQLSGGTAPDLVEYGYWYGRTAELQARHFEPLDRWLREPNPYNAGTALAGVEWRNTFLDGLDNPDCYNPQQNQFYGVSLCTGSARIFYNRTLLNKITGRDRPPEDFREFLQLCQRIRGYARQHQPALIPVAGSKDSVIRMSDSLRSSTLFKVGYRLDTLQRLRLDSVEAGLAYLRGEWNYTQPESIAGLELARSYCHELDPGALQMERESATRKFANGDAVMFGTGSFDAGSLRVLCPFEIGAFRIPFPALTDPDYGRYVPGPFSDGKVGTCFPFYLLRNSPRQDVALDFMRFMTSLPGVQRFADTSNWLPGIVGAKLTKFSREYMPTQEGYSGAGASFWLLSGPEAFGLFVEQIHELVGPTGSPAKFAAVMEARLRQRIIADMRNVMKGLAQNQNQLEVALAARRFLQTTAGDRSHDIVQESSSGNLAEATACRYRHTLKAAGEPAP